ncbi:hypothetical protein KUTeg_023111 [Tegillarca granosa]|uniref:BTB domain-containing protein n=1 Tax=Tegillarca granosa TaxID=220873 RepID=A0ABQ9E5N0_TEGGR|nr:hypothetical protein KUTeg_023111 [Tegillarca granosa]
MQAHRVVLVAACPMLQSMNDATSGSHLEVRLAADIKQDSINTFLQYLYEGFMMLTEENVQDVEKVARLLQVDSIIKCCADFHKCIQKKTGTSSSQYKYTFNDLVEFRHVRVSDLQKTMQERMTKRSAEMSRPGSPGNKRPRMHHQGGADDTVSMSRGYYSGGGGGGGPPDPWDRVPQLGSGMSRAGRQAEPGVIEIMEESIELLQTDPSDKGGRGSRSDPKSVKSVSISVASQLNSNTDLRVVNVTSDTQTTSVGGRSIPSAGHSGPSQRGSITVSPLNLFESNSSSSQSSMPQSSSSSLQKEKQYSSSSHHTKESAGRSMESPLSSSQRQNVELMKQSSNESHSGASPQRQSQSQQPYPVSMPVPAGPSSSTSQSKPYAAGSAVQASEEMTPPSMSPNVSRSSSGPSRSHSQSQSSMSSSPYSTGMPIGRAQQHHMSESSSGPGGGGDKNSRVKEESDISSTADLTPDLSIVKVEGGKSGLEDETGGLDMYVDTHDGTMHLTHMGDDEISDQEYEAPGEWGQESNEGSNISGDQNNSWMAASGSGSFQGRDFFSILYRRKYMMSFSKRTVDVFEV